MTWDVTDLGFRMGLSPQVPEVLAPHVGGFVADLLAGTGSSVAEVDGWAVHPGGPRILDVVERELALAAAGAGRLPGVLCRARQLLLADGAVDPR